MIVGRAVVTLRDDVLVVVQALLSVSQSEMQRVPPTNTSPIEPRTASVIFANILQYSATCCIRHIFDRCDHSVVQLMPSYLVSNDHMPPVTRDCRFCISVSKGMQAVKLCTNEILQFLTGGAG